MKSLKETAEKISQNADTALELQRITMTLKNMGKFYMNKDEKDVFMKGIIMQLEVIAGACTEIWWAAQDLESFAEGNQPAEEAERDN